MSSRNKEMQERARAGKDRKRSRRRGAREDDKPDFILGDGKVHYTRQPLGHLASEMAEDDKMDEAANLVRNLRPWAQRSTIGMEVVVDRFDHKEKRGKRRPPAGQPTDGELLEAVANRSAA